MMPEVIMDSSRRPILLRSGLLLAREAWSDGQWAEKESKHKICARDTFPIRRRNALLLPVGRTFFLLVGREERESERERHFTPRATLRYSGKDDWLLGRRRRRGGAHSRPPNTKQERQQYPTATPPSPPSAPPPPPPPTRTASSNKHHQHPQ